MFGEQGKEFNLLNGQKTLADIEHIKAVSLDFHDKFERTVADAAIMLKLDMATRPNGRKRQGSPRHNEKVTRSGQFLRGIPSEQG